MQLVKIGSRVVNMANVTHIEMDTSGGVGRWNILVYFVSGSFAAFEHSEAAMLMDWCRRNARDVQDWRGEEQDRGEEQAS